QSAAFPPTGWSSINVGTNGWKLATNAGAGSTRSARCNFYDMGDGQTAYLFTPKIDLSTATNATTLTFDHAYAQYTDLSLIDHLGIEVSTDCGQTWESIFYVGGSDLTTAPPSSPAFVPTAAQWQANELDLTPYNGQAEILIRFIGESGYGNNLYVDNVNVTTTVGTQTLTLSNFLIAPNPARDFAEVRFNLTNAQNVDLRVFNAEGALVQSQLLGNLVSGDHRVVLNAATLPSGSYRMVLQGSEGLAQTQMIVVK
ncbi:MAG: T9SS type A sorting domain-containing protein, partial [Saprospiraceae bacterium]|nr:T9SS type A sorting domain-containing protein [Saprospiraceae bacterium]